jgi:thioredoxin-like negative regulator of GroEL
MSSDLEVFLQQYDDLVLVTLWEENCEASAYMSQLLESIEQLRRVPVLKLLLAEHREWANQHGVHGTPALIVYYRHQPLFRVVGRVTPEELFRWFQNLQLELQGESNVKSLGQAEVTSPLGRLRRPNGTGRGGQSP